ncbi:MAG: Butyryl-CoA dehydrogenase [Cellvibrio sp.]|nr:Butyryl-CoA dehydrogenase [Cellvibrio sp.]
MQAIISQSVKKDNLADFCARVIALNVRERDKSQCLDEDVKQQLFDAGLMGVEIDEGHYQRSASSLQKSAAGFSELINVIEKVSLVDAGVSVYLHVHNVLVVRILLKYANEQQKSKWLPLLATRFAGAFAVTEPDGGSDLSGMHATATKIEGGFLISGTKRWITNAREAGLFIVFANYQLPTGRNVVSAFLVDATTPGVKVSDNIEKMSMRASSTCNVNFENVFVADDCLLGNEKSGIDIINFGLCMGRIGIAAQMLGIAQAAVDQAIAYSSKRNAFGNSINQYQAVSFPLAQCLAEIDILRPFIYQLAKKVDADTSYLKIIDDANKAKLFASQVAERATSIALEIFGGNGVAEEYGIEKLYRDAKVGKIYEGTVNILLRSIASRALHVV